MNIQLVSTEEEFLKLRDVWDQILFESGSAHIHSTFEWLYTWWKHFGINDRLFILVAEEGGEILGIAPLIIQKVGKFYNNLMKFNELGFLGVGFTDNADFIIRKNKEAVIKEFFRFIEENRKRWDSINLRQINDDSSSYKVINTSVINKSLMNHSYRFKFEILIEAPYLAISGSFEEYMQGLPSILKKQLKRFRRKLSLVGDLKFEVYDNLEEELFDEIYHINYKRNQNTGRKSMFLCPKRSGFLRDISNCISKNGWLKIFAMRLNGRLLSYQLAFTFGDVVYAWNTSYDPDYTKFSTGSLLTEEIVKYCFKEGYSKYDLMVGGEEYKYRWTNTISTNYYLMIGKRNIKSEVSFLYANIKKQLKDRKNVYTVKVKNPVRTINREVM